MDAYLEICFHIIAGKEFYSSISFGLAETHFNFIRITFFNRQVELFAARVASPGGVCRKASDREAQQTEGNEQDHPGNASQDDNRRSAPADLIQVERDEQQMNT